MSMMIFSADYLITPLWHHNKFFQVPDATVVLFHHMVKQQIQSNTGFWSQLTITKDSLNFISAGRRQIINEISKPSDLGPWVC